MVKESEIRIGINIGKADREDRGITVYTRNLLREFGKDSAEYQFVLLHYPESVPDEKFGIENAELRPLPFSDKHRPLETIVGEQILNPLQQMRLDLDVVWHPHNRGQFIVPVGYVCTMHDILPIVQPDLAGRYLSRADKKLLYLSRTFAAQSADVVITGSDFSKREVVKHLGVDSERVVVIPYGIDRNLFRPDRDVSNRERAKKTYSLPDRYLLTTGSYAPHKNLRTLVDAYRQSNLPKEGVGLVAVGPNDASGYRVGYNQLKDYIQGLGLGDMVNLLPSVPVNDLVTIYSNAEIFATASLYEGFGLTPVEAMACEVPVVVSNTTAIPEVCGNAVLYANPQNALEFTDHFNRLIEDSDLRQNQISLGRVQAGKYDWKVAAKKTLGVLKSVAVSRR